MKSIIQIVVDILFLINEYIGSNILDINFGLKFIQKIKSHDNITSISISNHKISKKIYIQNIIFNIFKNL